MNEIGQRVPAMGDDDCRLAGVDRIAGPGTTGIVEQQAFTSIATRLEHGRMEPTADCQAAEEEAENQIARHLIHLRSVPFAICESLTFR